MNKRKSTGAAKGNSKKTKTSDEEEEKVRPKGVSTRSMKPKLDDVNKENELKFDRARMNAAYERAQRNIERDIREEQKKPRNGRVELRFADRSVRVWVVPLCELTAFDTLLMSDGTRATQDAPLLLHTCLCGATHVADCKDETTCDCRYKRRHENGNKHCPANIPRHQLLEKLNEFAAMEIHNKGGRIQTPMLSMTEYVFNYADDTSVVDVVLPKT